MSIRTTVTLDEDVFERVKHVSRATGVPFKVTLNQLVRQGLLAADRPAAAFRVEPFATPLNSAYSYDDVEGLLTQLEGEDHR